MRRALAVLAVPALALVMSACGTGGTPAAAPKQAAQQGSNAPSSPQAMLAIAESPQLGWYVTNGDGLALYRFDADSSKPPKSTCEGECAKKWPPVPADAMPMAAGVDPLLLGSVTRADGTKQLTIAGFPQYTFAQDNVGELKGQGSGGKWYVTAPTGQKASASAGKPQTQPSQPPSQGQQPSPPPSSAPAPPPGY